ncbi:MAG: GspE/PulE family protein [Acinetobacter sp.]
MDFNDLLNLMIQQKASDLFITADVEPSMKINGQILPIAKTKLTGEITGQLLNSIMSEKQRKEFAETRECNFAISNRDKTARFRVSAFQQRDQPGMVLRRIETVIPTMDELKLPPILKELAMTKRGIIIFVGATGTGKSTSLASIIGYRNHNSKGHIITIEDPIEMLEPSFNQMQVNQGIDLGFADGVRALMRQDPDIIMVGEIRDHDTANMAIQAALTGHLVLSTLHTNDAPSSLTRLHDLGIQPFLTAATILGVLAQRLVRKLCPHCKQETFINEQEWKHLTFDYEIEMPNFVFHAVGCEECRHTGYKGRIGIYEFMPLSLESKQLIGANANLNQLRHQAKKEGIEPLRIAGARKVLAGMTTLEEVLRVVPLN